MMAEHLLCAMFSLRSPFYPTCLFARELKQSLQIISMNKEQLTEGTFDLMHTIEIADQVRQYIYGFCITESLSIAK